jgi:hypothetical protein
MENKEYNLFMDAKTIDFLINFEFPQKPDQDVNIHDIGIHNMYENPFTEILTFIIDSNSPYNNRDNFLKYFISELTRDENVSDSFLKKINVEIQINTKKGKFIDMIVYNDEYVITLENKIDHVPINPFKEYESEIKSRYNSQKKLYYLLSLHECENIDKWNNRLIGDIFSVIKNKLQFKYNNKWDYFVEDFLNHYIEEKVQMTKKDFNLCEKNFSKFMEGRDYLDQFIDEIIDQLKQKINPEYIKKEMWNGCNDVILLKLFEKTYEPNIALCLDYGIFIIYLHYDDQSHKSISELVDLVGNKYDHWLKSKGKRINFGIKENYWTKNLNEIYKEIGIQWKIMKKMYT